MKVKELIQKLQEYNPEATVSLTYSETVIITYIIENNATKMTTQHIFLEGADYDED